LAEFFITRRWCEKWRKRKSDRAPFSPIPYSDWTNSEMFTNKAFDKNQKATQVDNRLHSASSQYLRALHPSSMVVPYCWDIQITPPPRHLYTTQDITTVWALESPCGLIYIKPPMPLWFLRPRVKCFGWGQIHYLGHIQGWAQKIESCWGPEMALAALVPFQGPNNSRFSGPTPEYGPLNLFAPIKNISHGAAKIIGA